MIGDGVLLPLAATCFAWQWQNAPVGAFYAGWVWPVVCLVVAFLGSVVFFRMIDSRRYVSAGAGQILDSPTKLWHDYVTSPSITAILLWLAVPVITEPWTWQVVAGMLLLLAYVGTLIYDLQNPVNPTEQHPRWDVRRFERLD